MGWAGAGASQANLQLLKNKQAFPSRDELLQRDDRLFQIPQFFLAEADQKSIKTGYVHPRH